MDLVGEGSLFTTALFSQEQRLKRFLLTAPATPPPPPPANEDS